MYRFKKDGVLRAITRAVQLVYVIRGKGEM